MLRFHFSIIHVPGKQMVIADTLSRAPERVLNEQDLLFRNDTSAFVNFVMESLPASEHRIKEIEQKQKQDLVCVKLGQYCTQGWSDKSCLSGQIKLYHSLASEISIVNGLLMRNSRIIIPTSSHWTSGLNKCRESAQQSVWWPGLSKQLHEVITNCHTCCEANKQRPEPMISSPFPELPWQKLGMDLFEFNKITYY